MLELYFAKFFSVELITIKFNIMRKMKNVVSFLHIAKHLGKGLDFTSNDLLFLLIDILNNKISTFSKTISS